MFAAWQAGAWRAVAGRFKPDIVIGASAGALNAWAIAGGAPPDELVDAWLDQDIADLIRLRFGWTPFHPEPLRHTARQLTSRYRPAIPYGCTLVEVPRLRLRLVRGEEVDWRLLAAACAIPGVFPPVRSGKRWYVDGGLLGAVPLWAAAELGAERAIVLDALPEMPSRLVRGGVGLVQRMRPPRLPPEGFQATVIQPLSRLGGLRDALFWNAANVRRWIAQGEHDAKLSITI
jgi:NTE family protein